ncbi:MAG TPA: M81 family metallopeptidase [Usitatibacter sp.]|nr:M81 family metallopeptidase [Usitatibacter sp.]
MPVNPAHGQRIAVGGFMHETNTFQAQRTALADFVSPGDRTPLTRGEALLTRFRGTNTSIAGTIDALVQAEATLLPLAWCAARPSGPVTRDAYENIASMLLDDIRRALPLDGVCLALHGAMVAEHVDDGDGELLRRVREVVGPGTRVTASLDLHANVSRTAFENADGLVAYRTYPHVDMAETGARAAALLMRMLAAGAPFAKGYRQLPFLIPLPWQCTTLEPARSIFAEAKERGEAHDAVLSLIPGFPAADVFHCGPAIVGYGPDQARVDAAVDTLYARACAAEPLFSGKLWSPEAAIAEAMRLTDRDPRPVFLADVQDNPGAGGTSDTVGLLNALLRAKPARAAIGIVRDAGAAAAAHAAGVGATITRALGARRADGEAPVPTAWTVEALGDGRIQCTGPLMRGTTIALGPMAHLRHEGVSVVVSTHAVQAMDAAPFAHVGVDLATFPIAAVKSAVHFRAQFEPMSQAILSVEAPGEALADPSRLPFTRLRSDVRRSPATRR